MSLGLAASRAMADTLAVLHSLDPEALGLASFGKPGNYFERQIGRWSRQYLASTGRSPKQTNNCTSRHQRGSGIPSKRILIWSSVIGVEFRLGSRFLPTKGLRSDGGAQLGATPKRWTAKRKSWAA
jgi:hypothetical protein